MCDRGAYHYVVTLSKNIHTDPSANYRRAQIDDFGKNFYYVESFKSKQEAVDLATELKVHWHASFAYMTPVFMLEGATEHFLAFEERGECLKSFLVNGANKSKLYEVHLLKLLQKILIDLISVFRYLLDTNIEIELDATKIFIEEGSLMFVAFKWREEKNIRNNWAKLVAFIEEINCLCGYDSTHCEMQKLLTTLKLGNESDFKDLAHWPLFWSMEERRQFICDIYELSHKTLSATPLQFANFGQTNWLTKLSTHPKLTRALKEMTVVKRTKHIRNNPFANALDDFTDFLRQLYTHCQYTLAPGAFSSRDEALISVEGLFPDHMSQFVYCTKSWPAAATLLPRREKLLNLWKIP